MISQTDFGVLGLPSVILNAMEVRRGKLRVVNDGETKPQGFIRSSSSPGKNGLVLLPAIIDTKEYVSHSVHQNQIVGKPLLIQFPFP